MIIKAPIRKIIACVLALTMLTSNAFGNRIIVSASAENIDYTLADDAADIVYSDNECDDDDERKEVVDTYDIDECDFEGYSIDEYAIEGYDDEYDKFDIDEYNYYFSFISAISLLEYEGESKIFNNLRYNYIEGRLHSVEDALNNVVYFYYDEEGELEQIRFAGYVINVELSEHGLLEYYSVEGTGIGATYTISNYGIITAIGLSYTEFEIDFDMSTYSQQVYVNDIQIIDNNFFREESIGQVDSTFRAVRSRAANNKVLRAVECETGIIEKLHYGVATI